MTIYAKDVVGKRVNTYMTNLALILMFPAILMGCLIVSSIFMVKVLDVKKVSKREIKTAWILAFSLALFIYGLIILYD